VISDQQQRAGFLPLRALADILTLLLAVVVGVVAARVAIQMLGLGSAHWRHSLIDFGLDKVADITIFGLSVLFVVWFRRASRKTAWLPAMWWTCWLLAGLSYGAQATPGNSADPGLVPRLSGSTQTFSLCFLGLAGAILVAIIRTVSAGPVGSRPASPDGVD
jgi:hypothetical protein